jgi:chromate transporter
MREGSAPEVFVTFLRLGVTSFGGPIAHIGYFREEIVQRRRWIDDATYTDLVALCQFLPGPASSQVGFSLGLIRAGYWGGLAAWMGFTLPSAVLLTAFAYGAASLSGSIGTGLLHGLELVAVAVVAQAVLGMARTLCADRERASIAGCAAITLLLTTSSWAQLGVIVMGGLAGLWLCRSPAEPPAPSLGTRVSGRVGVFALSGFFLLLAGLPAIATFSPGIALFSAFYRSGALVFGGGHVVLPLLSSTFVGSGEVPRDAFLAGYGAAQAVPGPLFTFAAYLGAIAKSSSNGLAGALLGVSGIFLPGMLVLLGTLPFWDSFRKRTDAQAAMRGVNAAVVGLLGAALYNPLWTGTIKSPADLAIALAGFILLIAWRAPPLVVVILGAVGSVLVR